MPVRIQRKRTKGWKMPAGAVYVGRGSKWGNPFTLENSGHVHPAIRFACEVAPLMDVTELRGKDLACWCALDEDCHADVLIELANDETVVPFKSTRTSGHSKAARTPHQRS